MRLFFGKLGFVHQHLWSRNRLYQASILAGPAPLVGGLLAAAIWLASHGGFGGQHRALPPWAKPEHVDLWNTAGGAPPVVAPTVPLPQTDAAGGLVGFKPGWRMATQRIDLRSGYDVNVDSTPLTASPLSGAKVEMAQIIAQAPKVPLYAGTAQGFLAVRTAGVYALSARFDRPPAEPADCLIRLAFGPHRVTSNIEISVFNDVSKTYEEARFTLEPGLYSIGWAFTCWHDQTVTAPGSLTILVGHPDEPKPMPARTDEIVHREAASPSN